MSVCLCVSVFMCVCLSVCVSVCMCVCICVIVYSCGRIMGPIGCILGLLRFCQFEDDSEHSVGSDLPDDDLHNPVLIKRNRELAQLHLQHIAWKLENRVALSEYTFDEWQARRDVVMRRGDKVHKLSLTWRDVPDASKLQIIVEPDLEDTDSEDTRKLLKTKETKKVSPVGVDANFDLDIY